MSNARSPVYTTPDGGSCDVLGALPDAPGGVIVSVCDLELGLNADVLAVLLGMLGPDFGEGVRCFTLGHPAGVVRLVAASYPDRLTLTVSVPVYPDVSSLSIPHDHAAAVRAAVEEVAGGE
ncbi:hypothetical protein HII36_21935 [Nonomuraea sp. NN258]|uniref:hypothetical protein n=1 Tax=Nonomuraea antri TaxID=2730852 RepID=UPI00156942D6|nr:hypothetical protein [Nonomuraea antri]NRQ34488.1 hypothetical protein [Nonomuraea antri]